MLILVGIAVAIIFGLLILSGFFVGVPLAKDTGMAIFVFKRLPSDKSLSKVIKITKNGGGYFFKTFATEKTQRWTGKAEVVCDNLFFIIGDKFIDAKITGTVSSDKIPFDYVDLYGANWLKKALLSVWDINLRHSLERLRSLGDLENNETVSILVANAVMKANRRVLKKFDLVVSGVKWEFRPTLIGDSKDFPELQENSEDKTSSSETEEQQATS